jgi:hypothetical protein
MRLWTFFCDIRTTKCFSFCQFYLKHFITLLVLSKMVITLDDCVEKELNDYSVIYQIQKNDEI